MAKKTEIKLTRKQKAFADTLISNPKLSATKAALATYGKPDKPITANTARNISSENLAKPNILAYMQKHVPQAQFTVIKLLSSEKDEIKLRAAQDILDRTTGKPGQAIQQTNIESITINLGYTEPQTYIESQVIDQ